jgi:hypothetical protein
MKRLGIFGDSYAQAIIDSPLWPYGDQGWSALLKSEDPNNVDIYAKAGAGNDWIVDQVIQHHANYEQIIVIITSWPRLHFPVELSSKNNGPKWLSEFWANPQMIENIIKNNWSTNNIAEKILDYLVFIALDPSQKKYQQNNVIANCTYLKCLHPGAILIPVMKHYNFNTIEPGYDWCLTDISKHETELIGQPFYKKALQDCRPNHMSLENNQWFVEHIKHRLDGKFLNWDKNTSYQFKKEEELWRLKSK